MFTGLTMVPQSSDWKIHLEQSAALPSPYSAGKKNNISKIHRLGSLSRDMCDFLPGTNKTTRWLIGRGTLAGVPSS